MSYERAGVSNTETQDNFQGQPRDCRISVDLMCKP